MTKRLWIRVHALPEVAKLADGFIDDPSSVRQIRRDHDDNDMVVIQISDELAAAVMQDGYLITCGKVLAEGEKPPYVGRDPDRGKKEDH